MKELEADWRRVQSVWWLLMWRGTLGAVLIMYVGGFIIGLVGPFSRAAGDYLWSLVQIGDVVGGLVWWLYVVRMALRKKYKGFRLAVIKVDQKGTPRFPYGL